MFAEGIGGVSKPNAESSVSSGPSLMTPEVRRALESRNKEPGFRVELPQIATAFIAALAVYLGASAQAEAQGPTGYTTPPDSPPSSLNDLCARMRALMPSDSKTAEIGCQHAADTDYIARQAGTFTDMLGNIQGQSPIGGPDLEPPPEPSNPLTQGFFSWMNLVRGDWNDLLASSQPVATTSSSAFTETTTSPGTAPSTTTNSSLPSSENPLTNPLVDGAIGGLAGLTAAMAAWPKKFAAAIQAAINALSS
ncbi:MAG: hypothetical protein UW69_C0083G0003 [Microgenomates group bacterium GW2011_GWA2_44_7]|nr:MAG: hypothetical protein UW69_C0083G0003 [Microgenomates group bacterium GW2011_GWA2_44_7]